MAKLIIRDGKGGEIVHEIKDDVTTFGRSSANIIPMKDEKASRQHFRIEKAGDSFRLVDLGSRNGTEVNGVRVSSQTLKPGDVITVGEYKVTFDAPVQVSGDELGATVACTPLSEKDLLPPAGSPAPAPAVGAPAASPDAKVSLSVEPSQPRFVLEVVAGTSKGKSAELGLDPVTIGRHASNKLSIEDESASNYHAEVTKEAIGYVISDLGSTNGTKVNGEKVVKSPLAHNARVQIGSTEIVFKNLGAPTEEDAVFGTVVLDSDKLDKELAAAKSSSGAGAGFLKMVAALVLIGGIGYGGYSLVKWLGKPHKPDPVPTSSTIANPGFNQGTDADGSAKGWTPESGGDPLYPYDSRNTMAVEKGKGREKSPEGGPEVDKYCLKFDRDGAVAKNCMMACRQSTDLSVDKGFGYRASIQLTTTPSAKGLYGLRLTWLGDGRQFEEFATVSGAHPDWKTVELVARAPDWAERLRFACVAFGNTGSIWFDDAAVEQVPLAEAPRTRESLDFQGVKADLDAVGQLELERSGIRALSAELVAEGQGAVAIDQRLVWPEGQPQRRGEQIVFRGSAFDFSLARNFTYELAASKSTGGVRLTYSFAAPSELTLDSLALRLEVMPAFAGKIGAYTSGGRKPLAAGEHADVSELILSTARDDQPLVLAFAKPTTVKIEDFGDKKRLTLELAKRPSLGQAGPVDFTLTFASASATAARDLESEYAAIDRLFQDRNWKEFPGQAKAFRTRHPDAAELIRKLDGIEGQYMTRLNDGRKRADDAVKLAEGASDNVQALTTALDLGDKAIVDLKKEWVSGTALAPELDAAQTKLDGLRKKISDDREEQAAQDLLNKAIKAMDQKFWTIAKSYLATIIQKYPKTKAADQARKLLVVCDDAIKQIEVIAGEEERILKAIRNEELNKRWAEVVRKIKSDPAFMKYGKEMKDVTKHLEEAEAHLKSTDD